MSTVEKSLVEKVISKYVEDIYKHNGELDKSRLGKILTVVDGAISDETQRKAVKDLIHDAWYGASSYRVYPQVRHVGEALGLDLSRYEAMPVSEKDYNPYKELVQKQQ